MLWDAIVDLWRGEPTMRAAIAKDVLGKRGEHFISWFGSEDGKRAIAARFAGDKIPKNLPNQFLKELDRKARATPLYDGALDAARRRIRHAVYDAFPDGWLHGRHDLIETSVTVRVGGGNPTYTAFLVPRRYLKKLVWDATPEGMNHGVLEDVFDEVFREPAICRRFTEGVAIAIEAGLFREALAGRLTLEPEQPMDVVHNCYGIAADEKMDWGAGGQGHYIICNTQTSPVAPTRNMIDTLLKAMTARVVDMKHAERKAWAEDQDAASWELV